MPPTGSILESIKDREFAYVLSGTRLRVVQGIPKLDIGSIHLEGMNAGDTVELPRWIAEVLTELGFCENQEENFATEVFKAVNREKMAGENQIAKLLPDFYLKVRRHLASSRQNQGGKQPTNSFSAFDLEKTKTLIYDLIALRLRKILFIAAALSPPVDIKEKLTPEEYQIFDTVYALLQSWRSAVLEGR